MLKDYQFKADQLVIEINMKQKRIDALHARLEMVEQQDMPNNLKVEETTKWYKSQISILKRNYENGLQDVRAEIDNVVAKHIKIQQEIVEQYESEKNDLVFKQMEIVEKNEVIFKDRFDHQREQFRESERNLQIEINVLIERLKAKEGEIELLNVELLKISDYTKLKQEIRKLHDKIKELEAKVDKHV